MLVPDMRVVPPPRAVERIPSNLMPQPRVMSSFLSPGAESATPDPSLVKYDAESAGTVLLVKRQRLFPPSFAVELAMAGEVDAIATAPLNKAAAHLAGAVAAHTVLPVIGVPLASSDLKGLDALLATVQMPSGMPVATMAIGAAGATNAALMAAAILAVERPELREVLRSRRAKRARQILAEKLE